MKVKPITFWNLKRARTNCPVTFVTPKMLTNCNIKSGEIIIKDNKRTNITYQFFFYSAQEAKVVQLKVT